MTIQSNPSDTIPSLSAQNEETTFILPTATFDDGGTSSASYGRLGRLQREVEPQMGTAHVEDQDLEMAVVESEGVPTGQSTSPAAMTSTSQVANEPQRSLPQASVHQPPSLASRIYEGVKTTLRKVVNVSDVLPPLKSTAAGLLVICDTIDVSVQFSDEIRSSLPIYVGIWRK
jgi:hypothetical protein